MSSATESCCHTLGHACFRLEKNNRPTFLFTLPPSVLTPLGITAAELFQNEGNLVFVRTFSTDVTSVNRSETWPTVWWFHGAGSDNIHWQHLQEQQLPCDLPHDLLSSAVRSSIFALGQSAAVCGGWSLSRCSGAVSTSNCAVCPADIIQCRSCRQSYLLRR